MQLSGKLVIIGIFGVALLGAILTIWFQYDARRQSREFWGPENAVVIGRAAKVELLRLGPGGQAKDGEGQVEIDGTTYAVEEI